MKKIRILLLLMSIGLTGCDQSLTREYLLLHPDYLLKEYQRCQNQDSSLPCDFIVKTAEEFMRVSNQRNTDPEEFGKMILQGQMKLSDLQDKIAVLQAKTKSPAEEQQLTDLRRAYENQSQQIQMWLSVVSESDSPNL